MFDHYVSEAGRVRMMAWYDTALSEFAHESLLINTRFGQTHVIAAGSGMPVILLHGININASVWNAQIEGLSSVYRVIAPDVPGFAGRSAPLRIPYEGHGYAEWFSDLLDGLGIEQALVVGSSAGGCFALKMAAFAPERVAGLLLLNPLGLAPFRTFYYNMLCSPPMARVAQWMARRVVRSRLTARRLVERGMAGSATEANIDLAMILLHDYNRAPAPRPLPVNELHCVTSPVYLMVSEHELYTDPVRVETVARAVLPNLIAVEHIAAAGHDINKERPDIVNARIVDFIKTIIPAKPVTL
jgi:pimeloyl-ACP methyl ester carboxylesterase